MYYIIAIIATISLIGQLAIVTLFFRNEKLKHGLIPRMMLYLTISGIIQTIGILGSSLNDPNCIIFGLFRLYGGLSSILWSGIFIYSIKQLFMVFNNQYQTKNIDIREIFMKLLSLEKRFCVYSYGFPLLLIIYPLMTALFYQNISQCLCVFYNQKDDQFVQKVQLNIQKITLWIIPITLYLIYSLSIINRIKHLMKDDEDKQEIYGEAKKIIKQILMFPIITLICTLSYTIENLQSLFFSNIGFTQTSISLIFLSFWGFLNSLIYLSQQSIKQEFYNRKMSDELDM